MVSLGESVGLARDDVADIARFLDGEGLLTFRTAGGGIAITHRGILEVEGPLAGSRRQPFLHALYKATEGSQNNFVDMRAVGETVELAGDAVVDTAQFLAGEGHVVFRGRLIGITHKGILAVEHAVSHPRQVSGSSLPREDAGHTNDKSSPAAPSRREDEHRPWLAVSSV